jgi:hypothetical protein
MKNNQKKKRARACPNLAVKVPIGIPKVFFLERRRG